MNKYFYIAILLSLSSTNILAQDNISANEATGLLVGEKAPLFEALDADSNTFSLKEKLEDGPVVIIFYRGHWCPYCNNHIKVIQDSLSLIYQKGATVVAVSPQNPFYLDKMARQTEAEFSLVFDEDYKIAHIYKVSFKPEQRKIVKYNVLLNADLENAHHNTDIQLPIPATYIIDKSGNIVWRHFDSNYKKRSSVSDIVNNIP